MTMKTAKKLAALALSSVMAMTLFPAAVHAEEKTKITYWAPFSGGDGDIMTALVDQFNEQSETTEVEFMILKSEEFYTKLLAAMTSDTAPTVAINHITRIKEYVTDDLLEPLDELAQAQGV